MSLPSRDHQSAGVAVFSLSAQLADGGLNSGLPRHRGQPRDACTFSIVGVF
jgi:hypothetical protein